MKNNNDTFLDTSLYYYQSGFGNMYESFIPPNRPPQLSDPNETPHTHVSEYEPLGLNGAERGLYYMKEGVRKNVADALCNSPEHERRSVASRLWSFAKVIIPSIFIATIALVGEVIGSFSKPAEKPIKPAGIVTQIPQNSSNGSVRFASSGSSATNPSGTPAAGSSETPATTPADASTDESGSRDDLKGTALENEGRYIYWETADGWSAYGSRFHTIIKILLDTEEMTAKITFERGDMASDTPNSDTYEAEKNYYARHPFAECTCKVNRSLYLIDTMGHKGSIDPSEYEKVMADSWPKWANIDREKYHFLLSFTDFQWTTDPYVTCAYFTPDNLQEPYKTEWIGIPDENRGDLPDMRMFVIDGRTDYYVCFVVSTKDQVAVQGYPSMYSCWWQFMTKKEYTGGASDAAPGPTTPAATPTPTPTPVIIELGKPQVTATAGGTVIANDDGSVTIIPDEGKKIGQILVNGKPIPIPPDGRLTGFTPEDHIEVRFFDKNEPTPTLPPKTSIIDDNDKDKPGGSDNPGGGSGGPGGNEPGDDEPGGDEPGSDDGGGDGDITPTPTPTPSSTPTPSPTPSSTPTPSPSPTPSSTPTPSPSPTPNHGGRRFAFTRAQFLNLLWAYSGYPEAVNTINPYVDVSESDYFYQAVLWALETELIEAEPGSALEPNRVCTFQELVAIMQRYYRMF